MSLLKISQKACRKLGVEEPQTLILGNQTQTMKKIIQRCAAAVEDVVLEVLRTHPWSHALVWKLLAQNSTAPPFGYDYSYQAPVDVIRMVDVRESEDLKAPAIDFEEARGGLIYTDASPCYARYVVYDEGDLVKAKPDFINACAFGLAAEVAVPLARTEAFDKMANAYAYTLELAKLNDTATVKERQKDENRTNTILAARNYPGYVGDNNEEA